MPGEAVAAPSRPKESSDRAGQATPSPPRLVEAADLYRIPLWMLLKVLYAVAPIGLLLRLATLRGAIASFASPLRAEAMAAIEGCMGPATQNEASALLRRHFQFRSRARFARLWPQIRGFAGADTINVEGLHHLDEALAHGKGAILMSAHYGYARLIKPILRSHGRRALLTGNLRPGMPDFPPELFGLHPFTRVGSFVHTRILRLPRWSRSDPRFQETTGVDLPTDMNLRPHVGALARNEIIIVLADGRRAQALTRLPVFGMEVDFAPGALSLARATGAAALPVFVVDDPGFERAPRPRLMIHPPLELQVTDDPTADHAENLRRFVAVLETEVQACPQDWHWHAVRDGVLDPLLVER